MMCTCMTESSNRSSGRALSRSYVVKWTPSLSLCRNFPLSCNNPSFSLLSPPPPSGHQQSVQLPEGGPSAASGPGGPETGPLPGVRRSCSGPACVCVRTRRSLARLHLVHLFICQNVFTATERTLISSQLSAIPNLLLAAGNSSIS